MSGNNMIKMNYALDDAISRTSIHSVPCHIDAKDGGGLQSANVMSYFEPTIQPSTTPTILSSSLRGRPLLGVQLSLPNEYQGIVLKKIQDEDIKFCKETSVVSLFSSLKYWCIGAEPSPDGNIPNTIKWITLANSIHQEIDPEAMQ